MVKSARISAAMVCSFIFASSASAQTEKAPEDYKPPTCVGSEANLEIFESLAAASFKIAETDREALDVDLLALELMDCIRERDPHLRDKIGFTGLSAWLRDGQLSSNTRRTLLEYFQNQMADDAADLWGVRRSFAALNLSEVIRTDRIEAFLSKDELESVVTASALYMRSISDYRGYSDEDGWRHAVAHTSDLALQLILNDRLTEDQATELVTSVFSQVPASGGHAYTNGEYERLARPVIYAALSGKVAEKVWDKAFAQLADPAPLESWNDAFGSEASLARLHNIKIFGYVLSASLQEQEDDALVQLRERANRLVKALP